MKGPIFVVARRVGLAAGQPRHDEGGCRVASVLHKTKDSISVQGVIPFSRRGHAARESGRQANGQDIDKAGD